MIDNQQALPALLRRSFPLFLRFACRELGGDALMWNFHIDAMIHRLSQVEQGVARRLIITLPPRHLKSELMTAWIAWQMGRNPALKFICASYGERLAKKHAWNCYKIMTSAWYRRTFPNCVLVRKSVLDFETTRGGYRLSTSVTGPVTGRGADYIVIDDPMNALDLFSEAARKEVQDWFETSLQQRLERQDSGSIILLMQRLHEDDLAGYLLRCGGWDELRLPAIAPTDELIEVGPGRFYQRREGHALHPARQSLAGLLRRREQNSFVFEAQQNQNPVPIDGNWVDPSWFGVYQEPPTTGLVIASIDSAMKTAESNDFSVIIVARYYQKRFYILDVLRKRLEFGALRAAVAGLCQTHRVERLLIEDAASGLSLIQMLRPPPDGVPWPIACKANEPKNERFIAQASRIHAGEVVLPHTAPWTADFIKEIAAFPGGRFDDQADALAQLLRHGVPFEDAEPVCYPIIIDVEDPKWNSEASDSGSNDCDGWI